jgi:hypothetical protein
MYVNYRTLIFTAPLLVAAWATPTYSAAQAKTFPDIVHTYELLVQDIASRPLEGALVEFTATVEGKTASTKTECTTDADGLCKLEVAVSQNPRSANHFKDYESSVNYAVSKIGFYSNTRKLSSSFGSEYSSYYTKEQTQKRVLTIYQAVDYLSEAFTSSSADRNLRDQALKFMSLIRLQSLIVDADVMLHGMGTSSFKSKKYFQMKINTTTTFNSLKLDKYAVAKRLFDDSIRKILNPLNENISNPKSFYGYDLTIYGYMKNFANEYNEPEKVEYRFLIPQETVRRYKDKDISGQQVLDNSVILMNDERIELKLQ